jgi:hypothetical protein
MSSFLNFCFFKFFNQVSLICMNPSPERGMWMSEFQSVLLSNSQKNQDIGNEISDMKSVPKSKKALSTKILPGDWICNTCQLNNFAVRVKCINCGASHAGAVRPIDRAGDWTCPNDSCRFHNFANRKECHKCRARKPIRNNSSLKAGDWICSKSSCLAHNFAKRDACFQCGTIPPSQTSSVKAFFMDYGESLFSSQNPFSPYG